MLRRCLGCSRALPAREVAGLLQEAERDSRAGAWGPGLDRWNTLAIFLVLLTRSAVPARRVFVNSQARGRGASGAASHGRDVEGILEGSEIGAGRFCEF